MCGLGLGATGQREEAFTVCSLVYGLELGFRVSAWVPRGNERRRRDVLRAILPQKCRTINASRSAPTPDSSYMISVILLQKCRKGYREMMNPTPDSSCITSRLGRAPSRARSAGPGTAISPPRSLSIIHHIRHQQGQQGRLVSADAKQRRDAKSEHRNHQIPSFRGLKRRTVSHKPGTQVSAEPGTPVGAPRPLMYG